MSNHEGATFSTCASENEIEGTIENVWDNAWMKNCKPKVMYEHKYLSSRICLLIALSLQAPCGSFDWHLCEPCVRKMHKSPQSEIRPKNTQQSSPREICFVKNIPTQFALAYILPSLNIGWYTYTSAMKSFPDGPLRIGLLQLRWLLQIATSLIDHWQCFVTVVFGKFNLSCIIVRLHRTFILTNGSILKWCICNSCIVSIR